MFQVDGTATDVFQVEQFATFVKQITHHALDSVGTAKTERLLDAAISASEKQRYHESRIPGYSHVAEELLSAIVHLGILEEGDGDGNGDGNGDGAMATAPKKTSRCGNSLKAQDRVRATMHSVSQQVLSSETEVSYVDTKWNVTLVQSSTTTTSISSENVLGLSVAATESISEYVSVQLDVSSSTQCYGDQQTGKYIYLGQ